MLPKGATLLELMDGTGPTGGSVFPIELEKDKRTDYHSLYLSNFGQKLSSEQFESILREFISEVKEKYPKLKGDFQLRSVSNMFDTIRKIVCFYIFFPETELFFLIMGLNIDGRRWGSKDWSVFKAEEKSQSCEENPFKENKIFALPIEILTVEEEEIEENDFLSVGAPLNFDVESVRQYFSKYCLDSEKMRIYHTNSNEILTKKGKQPSEKKFEFFAVYPKNPFSVRFTLPFVKFIPLETDGCLKTTVSRDFRKKVNVSQ